MDGKKKGMEGGQVLDGSDIMELVENKEVFSKYVDDKFEKLDCDNDGKLSVKELQPAVAHIGAALGLPSKGSSPDSDHIYSEVLNEFTHGKEEKVSKSEFKEVLSDILIGMAAGLKRDPIVILRIDGEELHEYINSPTFETDMILLFSETASPDETVYDHIVKALQKLGVDHGLPPISDSWVMSNIVQPALESCTQDCTDDQQLSSSQETFLEEFKKVLEKIVERLKEQPVIVAHTENTYDGSAIKNLLANKFETDKVLNSVLETLPRDKHGRISKEYLRLALDSLAPSAGLPPYGAIAEMDKIINDVLKMVDADDGKLVKEDEFKKLLLEILASIMLQLEGNPVSVSTNSVVHEPLADPSSFLQTSTS
ncbi:putative acetylcholine regulator unc-18 [Bienertia sinuspersici]